MVNIQAYGLINNTLSESSVFGQLSGHSGAKSSSKRGLRSFVFPRTGTVQNQILIKIDLDNFKVSRLLKYLLKVSSTT